MTKRVVIDVNPAIYRQFRVACLMMDIPCCRALEELMKDKIQEWLGDNRQHLAEQAKQMFSDEDQTTTMPTRQVVVKDTGEYPPKGLLGKVFAESMK